MASSQNSCFRYLFCLVVASLILMQYGLAVAQSITEDQIVVTKHQVTVAGRVLKYTARAGRLPILNNETGEAHGQMFFIAYTLDSSAGAKPRPLTFLWNGGPGSSSSLVHLLGFGPRRLQPDGTAVDNQGTWLDQTDLVFVDPIGTGYSRPTRAEYGAEFYQTRGDAESVAEFIRVYRTRFDAFDAPIFLAGESYGVTRAAGVAAALETRGTDVRGVILLGLALPLGSVSSSMQTALGLPSLAVAAFTNGKLAPDLQRDLAATMKQAESWGTTVYAAALARRDSLGAAERDSIVHGVSRFTGLDPTLVDRQTLTVDRMQLGYHLLRREGKFVGQ